MHFLLTALPGVLRIEATQRHDGREAFARLCRPLESSAGIPDVRAWQISLPRNPTRHTLRGMHFQTSPFDEAKLVRVVRLRCGDRPALRQSRIRGVDCRATRRRRDEWVFVPAGCAHGFLTIQPDTDVM